MASNGSSQEQDDPRSYRTPVSTNGTPVTYKRPRSKCTTESGSKEARSPSSPSSEDKKKSKKSEGETATNTDGDPSEEGDSESNPSVKVVLDGIGFQKVSDLAPKEAWRIAAAEKAKRFAGIPTHLGLLSKVAATGALLASDAPNRFNVLVEDFYDVSAMLGADSEYGRNQFKELEARNSLTFREITKVEHSLDVERIRITSRWSKTKRIKCTTHMKPILSCMTFHEKGTAVTRE